MTETPYYYRGDSLDKLLPFLCPVCGGVNDARQYTLLCVAYYPGVLFPFSKCACPPEQPEPEPEPEQAQETFIEVANLFDCPLFVRSDRHPQTIEKIEKIRSLFQRGFLPAGEKKETPR